MLQTKQGKIRQGQARNFPLSLAQGSITSTTATSPTCPHQAIESLGLEKPPKTTKLSTAKPTAGPRPSAPRPLSTSRAGGSATSLGSLSQRLALLSVPRCCLTPKHHCLLGAGRSTQHLSQNGEAPAPVSYRHGKCSEKPQTKLCLAGSQAAK